MKSFISLIFSYLRRHLSIIIAIAVAMCIFAAVFSLYDLYAEAVAYSCVLSAAAFLLIGVFRFSAYYRRHRLLSDLKKRLPAELGEMPRAANIIEADYQELLTLMWGEAAALTTEFDRRFNETTDYYTLWAHQIKTPISAMRLLLQSSPDERAPELTAELFKIEQYVDMVLGYLRVDSGSTDLLLRQVDLDAAVRQSIRKFARVFILKKQSLDFKETGLTVLTDEKWLCFVVEQLLSNALKYTREGSICIYAEGQRLIIEDTGIGIHEEDLPRVFEKGFTGYNGRADKKSTGIGLYLCRRVLHMLGNTITIESEVGRGTRVSIDLSRPELIPKYYSCIQQ